MYIWRSRVIWWWQNRFRPTPCACAWCKAGVINWYTCMILIMLRYRSRGRGGRHLYRVLCSPAVSGNLLLSSSSSHCQNQQDHLPYDTSVTLVNDHLTHYHRDLEVVNNTAASKRIICGLRAESLEKAAQSGSFMSIGSLPWCTSAFHFTVNCHQSSLYAVQHRQFSLSAMANNSGKVY